MSRDETLVATCPRCGASLYAADEDELVANVRQHVRNDHGFEQELPRKHVLAYLRQTDSNGAAAGPVTVATITCPECGASTQAEMPTDACQFFWTCPACTKLIRPLPGDCCVFCSYADQMCPPKQSGENCS